MSDFIIILIVIVVVIRFLLGFWEGIDLGSYCCLILYEVGGCEVFYCNSVNFL